MPAINDVFEAYNRAHDQSYTYRFLGVDPTCEDTCYNIALQNVVTGDIMHVENEWFNQRRIKVLGA